MKKITISTLLLLLGLLWRPEFFETCTLVMSNNILHQAASNFLELQLTDQLCRMEPCHGPFFFNFHHKFSIGLRSRLFAGHVIELILFSWRNALTLCSVARCIIILKNDVIITKSIFYWWNETSAQNFNLHLCIDCWGNDCHLPWSLTWHATPYHKWVGKFDCFLQAVIFIGFIRTAPDKCPSIISKANADSWFITEYNIHSIIHTPWLLLFSSL